VVAAFLAVQQVGGGQVSDEPREEPPYWLQVGDENWGPTDMRKKGAGEFWRPERPKIPRRTFWGNWHQRRVTGTPERSDAKWWWTFSILLTIPVVVIVVFAFLEAKWGR
jgi:hypothetical protein